MNWNLFLAMLIKPFITALILLALAVVLYCFRRYMPDGRIRRYFLIARPEAKTRRRMRAEAIERERKLAAYDRGTYFGKRVREFLSSRERR